MRRLLAVAVLLPLLTIASPASALMARERPAARGAETTLAVAEAKRTAKWLLRDHLAPLTSSTYRPPDMVAAWDCRIDMSNSGTCLGAVRTSAMVCRGKIRVIERPSRYDAWLMTVRCINRQ